MEYSSKIYIAGHTGLVGSALVRTLSQKGYRNLLTAASSQLDLRDQGAVRQFFQQEQPEYVFLAAARVGGIRANSLFPVPFLYDNLMIAANTIEAAFAVGVRKFLFLGSSCIYPRACPQPIQEQYLLTGPLEETNEWYALAKIAGLKLCEAYQRQYGAHGTRFIAAMPTNVYGVGDTYDPLYSHVIPALIMKCCDAQATGAGSIAIWGSGNVRREFLYVDDLAEALVVLMQKHDGGGWINVGSGHDYAIKEVVQTIVDETAFRGEVIFDQSYPEGTPQKLLDVSRMALYNWEPRVSLREGIRMTIASYRKLKGVV